MQYCTMCGKGLGENDKFCPGCGNAKVEVNIAAQTTVEDREPAPISQDTQYPNLQDQPVQAPVYEYNAQYQTPPVIAQPVYYPVPAPERKKLSKKALILILSSCAAVLVLATITAAYFYIQHSRATAYDEAIMLMENGKYKEAQEMFVDLGSYSDAEELVIECQLIMDYNDATRLMNRGNHREAKSAFEALGSYRNSRDLATECQMIMDYDAAQQLFDDEMYIEAKGAFQALGSFRDSSVMAALCQSEIDYGIAIDFMDSKDYDKAVDIFAELGSFKNSVSFAEECSNWIVYNKALAHKNAENHATALELFEPLAAIGFHDSEAHALESGSILTYAEAEQAYEDEFFYTAYKLFMSIRHYDDSEDRAEQCIQDHPASGQVYRNPGFSGSAVSLRIRTPRDDPRPTFIKIYTADEVHVSSVFIRGGGSPTVRLPANTYIIRSAYGENWFGQEEMFGDENAYYQTLLLEGNTSYAFRRNYNYTLTLRDAVEGNVGSQTESRTGF